MRIATLGKADLLEAALDLLTTMHARRVTDAVRNGFTAGEVAAVFDSAAADLTHDTNTAMRAYELAQE